MQTFTLTNTYSADVKVGNKIKKEEVYQYQSDTGNKLCFRADPNVAFQYVFIVANCNQDGLKARNKFLNAWIDAFSDNGKLPETIKI